jgi:L-arabinokinase
MSPALSSLSTQLHTTKAALSSILYYITGHGYGHAVRSHQVIRALASARPDLSLHVRTTAPEWLFSNSPTPVAYSRQALDVGIVQPDSLQMELTQTLAACRRMRDRLPEIIERELSFIKANDIHLIVGDTPPLCFEIAARAAVPSVSITNFTWDVIYQAYLAEHPAFAPLIDEMGAFYGKASLALTLPYPCDTSMFPRRQEIPWIARRSLLTKAEARAQFALPQSATIVLLSFGGLGLERLPREHLKRQRDYLFVATGAGKKLDGNVVVLPDTQSQYEDMVRAADAIVTKPGYGIVADVLAHQLPILYTDRGEFPEYPRLVEALRDCATAEFIPQTELLAGNFAPYLTRLLAQKPNWSKIDLNGAEVAASKILEMLDQV